MPRGHCIETRGNIASVLGALGWFARDERAFQAAEKVGISGEIGERQTAGAKALHILNYLRHD